ncbi:amidophosphoribosyltransferase [Bdellovibrionota bacterium FG-2]
MCGVVGVIGSSQAAKEVFLALTMLQHRGQDAAGILSYDEEGFHRVRNLGLVEAAFSPEHFEFLTGEVAIGHARYSTIGRGDVADVQPFLLSYPFGIGMVHNGNLVNFSKLSEKLKSESRRHPLTHSDTEAIMNVFGEGLSEMQLETTNRKVDYFEGICNATRRVFSEAQGSYSVVTLIAGVGLVAFRDPWGIRPLIFGKHPKTGAYLVASESAVLYFLGYEVVRDVAPGEVVWIDFKGQLHSRVLEQKPSRHCMFEWVYFSSPESVLDGQAVYASRIGLGKNLAQTVKERLMQDGAENPVVVPVPETARIAAIALAEELGAPYRELLIKNRYIKRTFILDSQEKRQQAVDLKLSPVVSELKGRNVLLVDDSIVRGTTSRKIIDLVRRAGAAKVYFVSTCPPIRKPCFYGIDFPDEAELLASDREISVIEKDLGADGVIYQSLEGLKRSIGLAPPAGLCHACLDGNYPTDVALALKLTAKRKRDRLEKERQE